MQIQWPMHILRIAWFLAKPGIEICNIFWRKSICRLDRINAAQPQFLDQAILQGPVCSFDPAFGLRGVGADNVDVELVKSATKLGQAARAVLLRTMGRAKHTMLVTVKGQRLAPFLQVGLRRMKIIKRIL